MKKCLWRGSPVKMGYFCSERCYKAYEKHYGVEGLLVQVALMLTKLGKAKLIASKLSEQELYALRAWIDKRVGVVRLREHQKRILSLKPGALVVVRHRCSPKHKAWEWAICKVVKIGRTRVVVEKEGEAYHLIVPWQYLEIPELVSHRETERRLNVEMLPILNKAAKETGLI